MNKHIFDNIKYKDMKVALPTEESEQVALVQWLRLKKLPHFHIPNEGKAKVQYMKKQRAMGLSKGISDIVVFVPSKILFIEMKRRKKELKNGTLSSSNSKISKEQQDWIDTINCYDYSDAIVCYGFADAKEFIERYL